MSHLTVQEVIERINEISSSAKDQRTNGNRIEDQATYIPRMKRIFQECSYYLIARPDQNWGRKLPD